MALRGKHLATGPGFAGHIDPAGKGGLEEASDRVVAGRAADADPQAFEVLVRRYGGLMRAYARSILGSNDEPDDIVQESFVVAWQQLDSLHDPGAVKSWLMRIVSRRSIDRLRSRHEHRNLDAHDQPAPQRTAPPHVVEARFLVAAIEAAVATLPAAQRRCWLLREVTAASYREIAVDLGIPESTVRGLLARARTRMVQEMEAWR